MSMCLPIDEAAMLCWLKSQVRVIEAWREDLAMRPDIDLDAVRRLERHYQWLTAEVDRLDQAPAAASTLRVAASS